MVVSGFYYEVWVGVSCCLVDSWSWWKVLKKPTWLYRLFFIFFLSLEDMYLFIILSDSDIVSQHGWDYERDRKSVV